METCQIHSSTGTQKLTFARIGSPRKWRIQEDMQRLIRGSCVDVLVMVAGLQ